MQTPQAQDSRQVLCPPPCPSHRPSALPSCKGGFQGSMVSHRQHPMPSLLFPKAILNSLNWEALPGSMTPTVP